MTSEVLLCPPDPVETPLSAFLTFPTTVEAWPSKQPGISLTTDVSRLKLFSLVGTDLVVVCFKAALVRGTVWLANGLVLHRTRRSGTGSQRRARIESKNSREDILVRLAVQPLPLQSRWCLAGTHIVRTAIQPGLLEKRFPSGKHLESHGLFPFA